MASSVDVDQGDDAVVPEVCVQTVRVDLDGQAAIWDDPGGTVLDDVRGYFDDSNFEHRPVGPGVFRGRGAH